MLNNYKDIAKVARKAGSSFYLFDEQKFRQNYNDFLTCFTRHYPNTRLGYSYKTNYLPGIGKIVNELNGFAEVVSDLEYDIALKCGVKEQNIIFNGPFKTKPHIIRSSLNGIINIDNSSEYKIIVNESVKNPEKTYKLGIRVNFPIKENTESRFGIDTESSEFTEILSAVNESSNIKLIGLHCHFSTRKRSIESYRERTRKILEVAEKFKLKDQLEFIDIGGGFFGKMPDYLKERFGGDIPSYGDYAEVITDEMTRSFGKNGPTLIIEPGAAVIADTFTYYCQIVDRKNIRGKNYLLTSGSYQLIKPTGLNTADLKFQLISKKPNKKNFIEEGILVGYTCMEGDILGKIENESVSVDDFICFENMGAYTIVFKPPFILGAPPIIGIKDNKLTILRKKETANTLLKNYRTT